MSHDNSNYLDRLEDQLDGHRRFASYRLETADGCHPDDAPRHLAAAQVHATLAVSYAIQLSGASR